MKVSGKNLKVSRRNESIKLNAAAGSCRASGACGEVERPGSFQQVSFYARPGLVISNFPSLSVSRDFGMSVSATHRGHPFMTSAPRGEGVVEKGTK